MNILHVANGEVGAAATNVEGLRRYSRHNHELVAKWAPAGRVQLTEETTAPETILELASQADVLHFHGLGQAGALGNPCAIHNIDWAEVKAPYKIFHGYHAMRAPNGKAILPGGDRYGVANLGDYRALFGAYPSCRESYGAEHMLYVPDFLPQGWLYSGLPGWNASAKPRRIATSRLRSRCKELNAAGLPITYLAADSYAPAELLRVRRNEYAVALDNYSDGHYSLFGLESLAQGVPCAAYVSNVDAEAYRVLGAPNAAPFIPLVYGGADVLAKMLDVITWPDAELDLWAEAGRLWIDRYYQPERIAAIWDEAYLQGLA